MKTPPISIRRQLNHEATVQTILNTARAIMREEGVAALSMHEIARRMDMRAPSLYNYFSGKMEIYDALFRLGFRLYDEHLTERLKEAAGWHDELRIHLESYMSFALQNPDLYQLCFERPVPGFVPSQESLELSFGLLDRFQRRARQIKKQLDTDLSSEQIVNTVIAISHGITAMHLSNEPDLPLGRGRFGSLVPVFLSLLERAMPLREIKK